MLKAVGFQDEAARKANASPAAAMAPSCLGGLLALLTVS